MSAHTAATVALVIACLALAAAVVTLALTLRLMRQSGRTRSTLRRHRLAHQAAYGHPDPEPPDDRPRRGAIRYTAPTGAQPITDTGLAEGRPADMPHRGTTGGAGQARAADPDTVQQHRTQRPRPEKSIPR
jgi:HAMP domain-containing protein